MCAVEVEDASPNGHAQGDLGSVSVVLVNNDSAVRATLRQLLRQKGILACRETEDGHAALALLDGGYIPEIIICSAGMKPMDGMELADAMRRHGNSLVRSIPVILLADTCADTMLTAVATQVGIAKVLTMPISADQLAASIERMARYVPDWSQNGPACP